MIKTLLERFPRVFAVLLEAFPHGVADLRRDVLGDDAEQEILLQSGKRIR